VKLKLLLFSKQFLLICMLCKVRATMANSSSADYPIVKRAVVCNKGTSYTVASIAEASPDEIFSFFSNPGKLPGVIRSIQVGALKLQLCQRSSARG
jgi:hypothetical protein